MTSLIFRLALFSWLFTIYACGTSSNQQLNTKVNDSTTTQNLKSTVELLNSKDSLAFKMNYIDSVSNRSEKLNFDSILKKLFSRDSLIVITINPDSVIQYSDAWKQQTIESRLLEPEVAELQEFLKQTSSELKQLKTGLDSLKAVEN